MYPDLSYIFHAIFGTEPDNWTSIFKTFGLFLVLAILSAAILLYIELKRKAQEGLFTPSKVQYKIGEAPKVSEIISNAIFGFLVGFKLVYIAQNFSEFQQDAAGVLLSAKGNWLAGILGLAIFGFYRYWEKNKQKLDKPKTITQNIYPHDRIGDITMIAAFSGIIGAKVFEIMLDLPTFFADPIGTFFSGSGLAIYGGLIFGFFAVSYYLRLKKIPIIHVMDAVAPALIVSYGVGRMGCQFSGDGDWGIVNTLAQPSWWFFPDWLWAYDYPHNVINEGVKIEGCTWNYCSRLAEPRFPTPVYETAMAFAIGGILWLLRKRVRIPGMLFFIYLLLNSIERFWIEKIRVNPDIFSAFGLKFTQAEIIAIVLFLISLIGMLVLWRRRPVA